MAPPRRTSFVAPVALLILAGCVGSISPSPLAQTTPTATPPPSPAAVVPGSSFHATPVGQSYVIATGDTMSSIAARFGVSLGELLDANPAIKDPNKIAVGQVITIPSPGPTAAPTAQAPSQVSAHEESPASMPSDPGAPTMNAGTTTIALAGVGGCESVLYRNETVAMDYCAEASLPIDELATLVARGQRLVLRYGSPVRFVDGDDVGRKAALSVLAAPVSELRDHQGLQFIGPGILDLGARLTDGGRAVGATAPEAPGDYLVQLTATVTIGDWSWAGNCFYYRVLVP